MCGARCRNRDDGSSGAPGIASPRESLPLDDPCARHDRPGELLGRLPRDSRDGAPAPGRVRALAHADRGRAGRVQHRLGRHAPALGNPRRPGRRAGRPRYGPGRGECRARVRGLRLRLRVAGAAPRRRRRGRGKRQRGKRARGHGLVPAVPARTRARDPADGAAAGRRRRGGRASAHRRGRWDGSGAPCARRSVPGHRVRRCHRAARGAPR